MAAISKPDYTQIWASGGAIVEPSDVKKQTGWTAEVPPFQWENWIQNRQDQFIAHVNQRGIAEWDGLTEYEASGKSYVQGSDGKIYKSVAASGPATTSQNPTTDVSDTYWTIAFADVGTFLTETTGDARYLLKSLNGSDVVNATTFRTNIGAAALASPTFTGVPAAPTAAAGTNTTQLATTAFVLAQESRSLNSTRIDVASSSTVNLTSSAPNTRHINITGTTTINGFTIAIGQCYFVRFAGALTLTNSASLITQNGNNITTAAGDTCILRALAADQVEILCFTKAVSQSLGDGQSVQTLTGSRAFGTTYTNTTGRPIFVSVVVSTTGSSTVAGGPVRLMSGSGQYWGIAPAGAGANWSLVVTGVIPPGDTYSVANSNFFSLVNWTELR